MTPPSLTPPSTVPRRSDSDEAGPDHADPVREPSRRPGPIRVPRQLGAYGARRGEGEGPVLIVNAGIHGNEPAGVLAGQRLLRGLRERAAAIRGRLVVLAANREALAFDRRYLARDLNRGWTRASLALLLATPPQHDTPEDAAQRELLSFYSRELAVARGPVSFLDLHTSSAEGAPFSCLADTLVNRAWALHLPVPVILGLEEAIDGAVMEWFEEQGIAALAVEGGRHADPRAPDHLLDVICLSMQARGLWNASAAAAAGFDLRAARRRLVDACRGMPRIVEVVHRHALEAGDGFSMRPGYRSFQRVARDEVLADDRRGPVRAPRDGRVLLPLYQGQGDDGFFFARDVAGVWLGLAWLLRRLGLPALVTWLPGVRRDPEVAHGVLVDRHVARWLVVEVFHLLGFRKRRWRDVGRVWSFRRRVTAPSRRARQRHPLARLRRVLKKRWR